MTFVFVVEQRYIKYRTFWDAGQLEWDCNVVRCRLYSHFLVLTRASEAKQIPPSNVLFLPAVNVDIVKSEIQKKIHKIRVTMRDYVRTKTHKNTGSYTRN